MNHLSKPVYYGGLPPGGPSFGPRSVGRGYEGGGYGGEIIGGYGGHGYAGGGGGVGVGVGSYGGSSYGTAGHIYGGGISSGGMVGSYHPGRLFPQRPDVRQVVVSVPSDCVEIQNGQAVARYELISIRERHGRFRKAVPLLHPSLAIILGIFNTLLPGTGTFVAAFCVLCGCRTEYSSRGRAFALNLLAALIQTLTAPFVVGWVWSIMWSVTCVNISLNKDLQAMMQQQSATEPAVPL
ncbi:keratin, type II cytoskeletal 2 epidermal-like [Varroa destructor]|uniref:Protein stum n=1 Tax=Varroa destructor TaxID=109461 RepID=A0A7M7JUV4_VARDE|nr:keratin, type II cytoskeletal 2 epidermal-like [Varroa destructor]